jgi:hypothetical protein
VDVTDPAAAVERPLTRTSSAETAVDRTLCAWDSALCACERTDTALLTVLTRASTEVTATLTTDARASATLAAEPTFDAALLTVLIRAESAASVTDSADFAWLRALAAWRLTSPTSAEVTDTVGPPALTALLRALSALIRLDTSAERALAVPAAKTETTLTALSALLTRSLIKLTA